MLSVDDDGTITMAHAGTSSGRSTLQMNLFYPDVATDEGGARVNGYLRRRKDSDPARTGYLSGELWRGFATPEFDLGD